MKKKMTVAFVIPAEAQKKIGESWAKFLATPEGAAWAKERNEWSKR